MRDLPGQLLRGHAMQNSEKDIWISMGYESIIMFLGCIISRSEEKLFQKTFLFQNKGE